MFSRVVFGVDQILSKNPSWKRKRIGLLTNDGACTSDGEYSRKALLDKGFNIVHLFSPEHGISAAHPDGHAVKDSRDILTSLPVSSLYNNEPLSKPVDCLALDLILIDLQDVGVRCYTYLWTACELLQLAAEAAIPILVLDRPNPLGGELDWAEGPFVHPTCKSFLGKYNIPLTHYCSIGELLLYCNQTEKLNANVSVEKGVWERSLDFSAWEMEWTKPSPGLKSFNACALYPSLCFFEATNVVLARDQQFSFEFFGASWFQNANIKTAFENNSYSYQTEGESIFGIRCHREHPVSNPVSLGLQLLYDIKHAFPRDFKWAIYPTNANPSGENHLSYITGLPQAQEFFELNETEFQSKLQEYLMVDWKQKIRSYLLYS